MERLRQPVATLKGVKIRIRLNLGFDTLQAEAAFFTNERPGGEQAGVPRD